MMWFKKKPEVIKSLRPVRIAVHCPGGVTVVHYAVYRTIRASGDLCLHDKYGGGHVVADYAHGHWCSVSIGKRSVS